MNELDRILNDAIQVAIDRGQSAEARIVVAQRYLEGGNVLQTHHECLQVISALIEAVAKAQH